MMADPRVRRQSQAVEEIQEILNRLAANTTQTDREISKVEQDLTEINPELREQLASAQGEAEQLERQLSQINNQWATMFSEVNKTLAHLKMSLGSTMDSLRQSEALVVDLRTRQARTQQLAHDYIAVMQREANHLRQQNEEGLSTQPDSTIRATANILQLSIQLAEIIFTPDEMDALVARRERLVFDTLRQRWMEWFQVLTDYLTHVLPLARTLEDVPDKGILNESYRHSLMTLAAQCQAIAFPAAPTVVPVPTVSTLLISDSAGDSIGLVQDTAHRRHANTSVFPHSITLDLPVGNASQMREATLVPAQRIQLSAQPAIVPEPEGTPMHLQVSRDLTDVPVYLREFGNPDKRCILRNRMPEIPRGDYTVSVSEVEDGIVVRLTAVGGTPVLYVRLEGLQSLSMAK